MVRLLLILAIFFLINETQAISFEKNEKSCELMWKYSGTDNAFGVAVDTAVHKKYPKGDFSSDCLNAQVTPINKTSASVTAVYLAHCSYAILPKGNEYLCVNENNVFVGDRYYEVTGTANCFGKPDAYPCVVVKSAKEVSKPPSPPSPPPVGKWIMTPIIYVPQDIQKAALAYLVKNAKITTVAPAETRQATYYGDTHINYGYDFYRKIDANGGVTYRVPATVVTRSAATGEKCQLPILSSTTTVDVEKTGPGKYTYSNMIDERTGKAAKQDSGKQPACIGKAPWKAGVAKVNKYCAGVKGGCFKMDIED